MNEQRPYEFSTQNAIYAQKKIAKQLGYPQEIIDRVSKAKDSDEATQIMRTYRLSSGDSNMEKYEKFKKQEGGKKNVK